MMTLIDYSNRDQQLTPFFFICSISHNIKIEKQAPITATYLVIEKSTVSPIEK